MKNKIMILVLMLGVAFTFTTNTIKGATIDYTSSTIISLPSSYYAVQVTYDIPLGIKYLEIELPYFTDIAMVNGGGVKSSFTFVSENLDETIIEYEDLGGSSFGRFTFVFEQRDLVDIVQVKVFTVKPNTGTYPSGYATAYADAIIFKADDFVPSVIYYSNSVIYYTGRFIDIPIKPADPTPPEGYVFSHWALNNGEKYNFTVVETNQYINDTFYLYAIFYPENTYIPPTEPVDNVPDGVDNILSLVGLDNTIGYRIAYSIIALGLLLVCAIFIKSSIVIAITQIGWLGIAMFFGMVDLWTVAVVLLVTLLIIKLRIGDVS